MTFDNHAARPGVFLTQHEATGAHVAIEYPAGTRMGGRVAFSLSPSRLRSGRPHPEQGSPAVITVT